MNTTFWGPSGWTFLHTLTFIYPKTPSYTDKVTMEKFMNSISYILPCKYCRASFYNYTKSMPITNFLDTREKMIEWLYKIHNKVNKKLRSQGLCKHKNPELNDVKNNYIPIIEKINSLCNNSNTNTNTRTNTRTNTSTDTSTDTRTTLQKLINYICNLGKEFLGSIIFNYQGYYNNCHTVDEKLNIILIYHTFFNSILPLLYSYLIKFSKECHTLSRDNTKLNTKFNIKQILNQNEAYSKLIKWFYKCDQLCTFYNQDETKTFEDYTNYYKKHIVLSCNNPLTVNGKKLKSCRKTITKLTKKRL